MRIEQVTFRGFKSLHDLTMPLGDMTVLTGPNGGGKSNVLAALEFLGSLYRVGLDRAVAKADGYDRIAHRQSAGPTLSLGFDVHVRLDRSDLVGLVDGFSQVELESVPEFLELSHAVDVDATPAEPISVFSIGRETFRAADQRGLPWVEVAREGAHRRDAKFLLPDPPDEVFARFFTDGFFRRLVGDESAEFVELVLFEPDMSSKLFADSLSRYFLPLRRAQELLSSLRYLQLVPQVCRLPGLPGADVRMGRHGEDLAAAAEHVRQHDDEAWQKLQEAAIGVVPGLARVEVVPTEDRRLALQFYERGVLRPWRAAEVSDGTVQAFALFTALFDRRLPLLAVEEPENALHPWILREFIDHCHAERSKQVVLTTHSPALIDYVPGEWVNLVWREEGATRIGRLLDMDPDVKKLWQSGEVGLFDIYDGGVVPRSVPGG